MLDAESRTMKGGLVAPGSRLTQLTEIEDDPWAVSSICLPLSPTTSTKLGSDRVRLTLLHSPALGEGLANFPPVLTGIISGEARDFNITEKNRNIPINY